MHFYGFYMEEKDAFSERDQGESRSDSRTILSCCYSALTGLTLFLSQDEGIQGIQANMWNCNNKNKDHPTTTHSTIGTVMQTTYLEHSLTTLVEGHTNICTCRQGNHGSKRKSMFSMPVAKGWKFLDLSSERSDLTVPVLPPILL